MAYTLSGVSSLTTATQIGYDWYAGNDNYSFNVRISIVNTTTNTTLVSADTVVAPGVGIGGTDTQGGLSPSTNYTLVMTIRRASNYETLGTRTATITTSAPPTPAPPSWSDNFPDGQVGVSYSGSAAASTTDSLTWGFNTAPSIPGLSLSYNGTTGFTLSGTPTTAGTYTFSATATDSFEQSTQGSWSVTIAPAPTPTGTVPNVIGQNQSNASSAITNAGFTPVVGNATTSGASPSNNGTVASQSPGGGTTADLGSNVTFSLYNYVAPTGTVPNVVGLTSAAASSAIQSAGFVPSSSPTTVGATSVNNGKVKNQSPSAGTTQTLGITVSFEVYNYIPPQVIVPNVVGETQSSAISILQADDFTVNTGTTTSGANSSNNGTVASQTPSAGSSAELGSAVTISIYTFNPPVWTDNTIVNTFVVGTSYSDSVAATNSPSYSITSGTLPAGISINSITGAITGTPTTSGDYSFVISATNSFGSVSVTYGGVVTAPPVWSDQTLANFLQGRVYSDAVAASNSPTYTVTSGSLPAGISLNSTTGAVTGTPTGSGNYSFTISAANVFATITASFSGTIKLPPNWTDNQLGSFINGVDYSDSVTATNSPTYSVSAGTLPAGTSLNTSTGVISGTVTAAVDASYSFTITATNTDGTVSQAFSGTVQPDLGGNLKLYADGAWSDKEVYVYDGTEWDRGTVYIYNGTSWSKSVF